MEINTDPKKIEDILERGTEDIYDKENLKKRMLTGEQLKIKLGVDPTGPKIHLGRASQFFKLRDFQQLGHKIILIIGDFTALIGDASDKNAMRKPLTEKEIKENMKDYLPQIGKILDLNKVEVYYNSNWISRLSMKTFLLLSMNFTSQQLIQRRNFKERWDQGKQIGLHEMFYPLFQGYDSVAIRSDVEIGGFDQLFNLNTGRDVQKFFGQKPQDIMTLKMLSGLDGRKMSTSWGNVINILDEPEDMFGKILSAKDEMIIDYFELCTRVSLEKIKEMKKSLKEKTVNPKELKILLAKQIVSFFWGEKEAESAEESFERIFKEKKIPKDIKEIQIEENRINILELLVKLDLVSSKAEARRIVGQGGVKFIKGEDIKIEKNWQEEIELEDNTIVQVGKRKFAKIKKGL